MKERGLRSPWGTESIQTRGFTQPTSDEEEEAPMDRQYVGIDFHRRRSVIVRVSAAGEKLSGVGVANDALAMAGAVAGQERRTRRHRPGRHVRFGPAAGGVDPPAGDPGAAGAGALWGQARRLAFGAQGS